MWSSPTKAPIRKTHQSCAIKQKTISPTIFISRKNNPILNETISNQTLFIVPPKNLNIFNLILKPFYTNIEIIITTITMEQTIIVPIYLSLLASSFALRKYVQFNTSMTIADTNTPSQTAKNSIDIANINITHNERTTKKAKQLIYFTPF